MTLLEYAANSALDVDAIRTIACLLDSVAYRLDSDDQEAIDRLIDESQRGKRAAKLDIDLLYRAFPWISELTNLNLSYSSPKIRSLEAISFLPNLKSLYVGSNAIEDVTPLRNLKNLKVLHLSDNPVREIDALGVMESIHELTVDDIPASDLSPIERLPYLEELTISISSIEAFRECKRLPALKYLSIRSMFGSLESFQRFPDMPQLLEIVGPNMDSLAGIERFPSLVNLTNLSGDFSDLSPIADLPRLTHFNALRCQCDDLNPLTRCQALRDIRFTSDHVTSVDALVGLSDACEIHISGSSLTDTQQSQVASMGSSWDREFLASQPTSTPGAELRIVTREEFDRFDGREPFGIDGWDGNRRLLESEAEWLDGHLATTLNEFLEEQSDYYLPSRVRYSRSTTVVLYSEKATAAFTRIVREIQQALANAKNKWIVYLHSDMFESGSDRPNFAVWVYPDHLEAQKEDAALIQELLEA